MNEQIQIPQEILDWGEIKIGRVGAGEFYPVGLVTADAGHIFVGLSLGVAPMTSPMTSKELWEQHFIPLIRRELAAGRLPVGLVITDVFDSSGCEPAIFPDPCVALLDRVGITVEAFRQAVVHSVQQRRLAASQVVFPGQWADSVLN